MRIIKKIVISITSILIISIVVIHFFSPVYTNANGELYTYKSIEINDSVPNVYRYMGNSDNAKNWSVYVNHISLIDGEDGKVNCKRRCFKNKDETGIQWDEEILEVIPNKKRVLSIYNGKGFSIYSENLITEQQYEQSNANCKLILQLTLKGKQSFIENFKFKFASFVVLNVFKRNLTNIKKEIEKQ